MRFSSFGFPVHVHATFWLMCLVLSTAGGGDRSWPEMLSWVAIVFVSVLIHELGHAFAMRGFGRSPSIELIGMGGLTSWGDGPRVGPRDSAIVSLAGPFAGFAFAVPFAVLYFADVPPRGSFASTLLLNLLWVNVGWGIFNLLPLVPFDGSHVFHVICFSIFGNAGARIARGVSLLLAIGATLLAIKYHLIWVGFLAGMSAFQSYRALTVGAIDPSIPESKAPTVDAATDETRERAWNLVLAGEPDEAIRLCHARLAELQDSEETGRARSALTEIVAWALLERGDDAAALATRSRFDANFGPSALLRARLGFAEAKGASERADALDALDAAYRDTPGDYAAIVAATAWLDADRPDRSVELLRGLRGNQVTTLGHRTISAALYYAGHFEQALAVSELGYARFGAPVHAYNAACCLGQLGRISQALDSLEKSVRDDYPSRETLVADRDLDPLRTDPRFDAIVAGAPRSAERAAVEDL